MITPSLTRAPFLSNSFVVARPIPCTPPVIRATLFANMTHYRDRSQHLLGCGFALRLDYAVMAFVYPSEWSDEDRMHFLLSPFPIGSNLPPSNDQKVKFWSSLILESGRDMKKPCFTEKELAERFKWKGITPR